MVLNRERTQANMSVIFMPTDSFKFIKRENIQRFRELRRRLCPLDEIVIKPIRFEFQFFSKFMGKKEHILESNELRCEKTGIQVPTRSYKTL